MPISISEHITKEARALGFDACGVVRLADHEDALALAGERLRASLGQGHHATMGWMDETAERRADPRAMWADARSAIVLALNYGPERDPLESLTHRDRATISVYARNRDYHGIIKGKLKTLASKIISREPGAQVKVFVDTAPLMEKPLAQMAGLGWQGKHSNLVSRDLGSWTFLGTILTDLDLPSSGDESDHCGNCRACLDVCPTDAFAAPYRLDAARCISYLTIEHEGPIPHEFRRPMGNRIYGCDDCLAVCPWNKFARAASEAKLSGDPEPPRLAELLALDDTAFRARHSGSPIKRIGRNRFVRNAAIAAGNAADPTLVASLEPLTRDEDAVVAEAARWAIMELAR
ncbi:tRNA epoxyqueuosine(34) reductase QueG [Rhizobiaceae bacterium]|nr:tRNA epoxyqueuosine(34) reductase QueG [Rhizobiaceae bacterium]